MQTAVRVTPHGVASVALFVCQPGDDGLATSHAVADLDFNRYVARHKQVGAAN